MKEFCPLTSLSRLLKTASLRKHGAQAQQPLFPQSADSAIKIRNNIENEINKSGKILPTGKTIVVPMKNVVDYLGLDLNYIIEMASTELNLLSNDRALNYASISR